MKYTVWYIEKGEHKIWATGLTYEDAQAAVSVIQSEFGFEAGMEEE